MSISSIPSSALSSLLQSSFISQTEAAGSATGGSPQIAVPPQDNLATDFTSLLTDLASGDVSKSQSDLTQLSSDLQAADPSSASLSASSTSPVSKLLTSLASSLGSGNTTDALKSLTAFLAAGSNSTGNVVNTTA